MKRRLTLAILGTVAATLVLAGVGTLVFARGGVRRAAEEDLRSQAESTALLVELAQTRADELIDLDLTGLRELLCTGTASSTPPDERDTGERLRRAICLPPAATLEQAQDRLCTPQSERLDAVLSEQLRSARTAFCRSPDQDSLNRVRDEYCRSADPVAGLNTAGKRRFEQARRIVCGTALQEGAGQEVLATTLSKESIDLIQLGPDHRVLPGTALPPGLSEGALQADRLRSGETVSGPIDNGLFAAAPINPDAPTMSVILIARPSDFGGGLLPWFLLASGITLLIGAVVAERLGQRLTRPLADATAVTTRIAGGDLTARLPEHHTGGGDGPGRDELEQLARSINTMAEELERSRGLEQQFLLSISHDLRTPLTSIRGYAEAIADGAAPDPDRAATVILTEARRLERLVKDLLDLAKLDARTFVLHPVVLDLGELAEDSAAGFRNEVAQAGLALRVTRGSGPALVSADPDRLQQVIANLVENAVKYARSTVELQVTGTADQLRLLVIDDGPGIAEEDRPHVFERLYVTAATPQRRETGSGLGLAIVRELVDATGGTVTAEARPDGAAGTCMVVTLPRHGDAPAGR